MKTATSEALERTHAGAVERLHAARTRGGFWEGELSSSALSTATAAIALELHARSGGGAASAALAGRARAWLAAHPNADGGFGDTVSSPSNLATTALAWAALGQARDESARRAAHRAGERLARFTGSLEAGPLTAALLGAYGKDRTFSVPILVACALAERLGEGRAAWRGIPRLPFELAALPAALFRHLGLPMVSYALPALIAIGQVLHARNPSANPLTRAARGLARAPTLRELEAIQPASGGYLEATPLTSFVVASLIGCGRAEHAVVRAGVRFLADSARADGSWPIDTNLATWLSALAVDALGAGETNVALGDAREHARLVEWFLAQQLKSEHRYTRAAPGGWAWTDRSGGVPDADDTSAVVLALRKLASESPEAHRAAAAGLRWLCGLQNRDGGMPTFCRGWSGLPFDRSTSDISAHALRAAAAWETELEVPSLLARGLVAWLTRMQHADGSWLPLWFGNQHDSQLENPLYGTARVLAARGELVQAGARAAVSRAERWLVANQNEDGGFGARRGLPSTIEETALGLGALAEAEGEVTGALRRGVAWLAERTDGGRTFEPAPIGLYFARLWYAEALYPVIFSVGALARARRRLRGSAP